MTAELAYTHIISVASRLSINLCNDIRAIGPMCIPRRKDRGLALFLARCVVGQQLSATAARSIRRRIDESAIKTPGGLQVLLLEKGHLSLRSCGVSRNKIKALTHVFEAAAGGGLDKAQFQKLNHEERSERLTAIWGIGQWTSDMASIFYFRDPDVWPLGDTAVARTFASYLTRKRNRLDSELCAAGGFSPFRSFLAIYMWEIVDTR